jgi:2-oxoglutarate/2-oxoacid ferredoxin oxidoreductase subunit alpha
MPGRDLTIAIVGSGGDGVITAGEMIARAAAREGLHVIKSEAYGPQIRGGESSCTVRVSTEPQFAQPEGVDVLVVFNWADFGRFQSEITPGKGALVIHEADEVPPEALGRDYQIRPIPVALAALAKEVSGTTKSKNIFTLGLLCAITGLPADSLRAAVAKRFKKSAAALESNQKAFDAGLAWMLAMAAAEPAILGKQIAYKPGEAKLLMSGNEAVAVGAIHAGCRFFAGYPITPSSEVLQFLAEWLPKIGGSSLQTEDELAAIGAVIGGSFAGVKSMTATSGPGLSLMSEMIGLSSIAEIPSVIVNVQRGGPSTGIPTKSEQSDLAHAVWGSHGDAPRVVLAVSNVEDCFHQTVDAFNISEEFQVPVILLSDQLVGQRRETVDRERLQHDVIDRRTPTVDELTDYKRYSDSANGVSPMSVPGMPGGMYQTNGLEHDESGRPNSSHVVHERMNEKRFRKIDDLGTRYPLFRRFGPAQADLGVICWGSSEGPVREAMARLERAGVRVAAFVPQVLVPFPAAELTAFIGSVNRLLVIELSYAAQFYRYLRTVVDFPAGKTSVFKRSGGKNLSVGEVQREIEKLAAPVKALEEVLA